MQPDLAVTLRAIARDGPKGFYEGPVAEKLAAAVRKAAGRILGAVKKAAQAARVRCTCVHVMGAFPHEEIVKAARRYRCDLIVIASHGRRGVSRLLLGSETSKVLAHAKVPVLVVR